MKIKEFIFGNYESLDNYVPSLIVRIKNKINRKCSCGIFRYCLFDYIFPNEIEKSKIMIRGSK